MKNTSTNKSPSETPVELNGISYQLHNFSLQDQLQIAAKTIFEATEHFARHNISGIQTALKEKLSAHEKTEDLKKSVVLLSRVKKLIQQKTFEINGIDYLEKYMITLESYCRGANMSLVEGVFLQSFADLACQTVIVNDKKQKAINVIHIEENPSDEKLFRLAKQFEEYRKTETHEETFIRHHDLVNTLYHYHIVTLKTPKEHQTFFAYPGLCAAGPAFAIDFAHKTLFAADTLVPKPNDKPYHIWANAIVSMIFDCGDIKTIHRFMKKMKDSNLNVLGGYAVHIVSWGKSPETRSYEFSSEKVEQQKKLHPDNREIIGQTNYPLSKQLRTDDLYGNPSRDPDDIQLSHVIKRRTNQLCVVATREIFPTTNAESDTSKLLKHIASPVGDVETFDHGSVFAGFPTPYTASHLVASFSPNKGKIIIGKLSAPPIAGNEYALLYDHKNPTHQKNMLANLKDLKKPIRVAIIYSTPTKRLIETRYAATDEDTSYVAGKVAEALKTKNIDHFLVELRQDALSAIDSIDADCIINLMEWTGLDISLAKKTFEHLRKLQIPVTGATWENYFETTNKDTMKKAFEREHIQTPDYQVFVTGKEPIRKDLLYPLIVKPAYEHGSIGLNLKSIAHNSTQLQEIVLKQITEFYQPAIAETFIHGRELLVYLLEEQNHIRILPVEEITFQGNADFSFQTYECKWDYNHPDYKNAHVICAKLSKKELQEIERVCLQAFRKLGFRGYARFDIRLKDGIPYILETNANPNIYDSDDDQIPGIAFPDFIEAIISSAIYHFNHGWKI